MCFCQLTHLCSQLVTGTGGFKNEGTTRPSRVSLDHGRMDETAGWPMGEAVPCGYRACPYEHRVSITTMRHIVYKVETEVETDGRWIAEITDLPGVLAYGSTEREAVASAQALALRVLADRIEEEKEPAETVTVSIEAA